VFGLLQNKCMQQHIYAELLDPECRYVLAFFLTRQKICYSLIKKKRVGRLINGKSAKN
jgi:hypothetical protein